MADEDLLFQIDAKAIIWEALDEIQHFAKDQLPYAQAKALFDVTHDARRKAIAELPKKFTIRTKPRPWAEKALFVHPKSPTIIKKEILSGKNASVTIRSMDPLGRLLTDGGIKRMNGSGKGKSPFKDDHGFGVPFLGTGRKSANTIIREGKNSPEDIVKSKNGFLITTKAGKKLLIMPPKKYKKGKSGKAQRKVMFVMKHQVKIKPWWNFREILLNGMLEWLPARFIKAAKDAMKTRKRN